MDADLAATNVPKVKPIDERLLELATTGKQFALVRFLIVPQEGDPRAFDITSEYSVEDPAAQAFCRQTIIVAMAKEQQKTGEVAQR